MDHKLNPTQLEAVEYTKTPLLIIAGAGTGKTTVITEKIKYLIREGIAKPEEILALTFTEKASQEMQERVDLMLPLGYSQMWIMTFHSFCDRILRAEGLHIGLDTNYTLMTQVDSLAFLKKHLFELQLEYFLPLGNPHKFLSALLTHFSRLADEDVSSQEYLDFATEPQDVELAKAFKIYQELKIKYSKFDFSDLITYALKLLRTRPNILIKLQSQFKYILVDEFQDTNYAQNILVNLLTTGNNLTVVGDSNQSIYRFRGASYSNILEFEKKYPNVKIIVLNENYRSTQEILDKSFRLISFNNIEDTELNKQLNQKLIAKRGISGLPIELIHTNSNSQEADAVAEKILELKVEPKDVAILVRANAHAEPFLKSLNFHGIPAQFLGPAKLFSQPEVKDLLAFLRLMADPTDDITLYRLLSNPFFKIDLKDLAFSLATAKKENKSLFETLDNEIVNLLNSHLLMVPTMTAGQILYSFLEKSGILKNLLSADGFYSPAQTENITRLFNKIKVFEDKNEDNSVTSVLDWIEMSLDAGESPAAAEVDFSDTNAVNIMTIHSAKGLEFPIVFLVNLVSQRFPSMERAEAIPIPDTLIKETLPVGDFHLQEERRLFYVGLTRARDRVFLTAADYYGDAKRPKKLSPFITETLGNEVLQKNISTNNIKLINISDKKSKFKFPREALAMPEFSNFKLEYLSYTQIQTFLDCPLHYKAKYILHLPTPPSAASTFGNIIHATLKDYFIEPQDVSNLLNKNWSSRGFINKTQEQKYKVLGEKYLTEYVKALPKNFVLPKKLEEPFNIPVSNGVSTIKIGGKIDRLDFLADGTVEIIDYKTGKTKTQKDVDNDLQLSFYALAAKAMGIEPAKLKLSLYFFESQQKITTTRSEAQLEVAVAEIFDYVEQIEASDFACSRDPFVCAHCDFQSLCEVK